MWYGVQCTAYACAGTDVYTNTSIVVCILLSTHNGYTPIVPSAKFCRKKKRKMIVDLVLGLI